MDQHSKRQLIKTYQKRYKRARRAERTRIVSAIVDATGYCRKHVIRALNRDLAQRGSDAGVLMVSLADKSLGLTEAMAGCVIDTRQQSKVDHFPVDIIRERVYAICQDYEDANDLDVLGSDPALKSACVRLPKSGLDLASQPTISRFENMPSAKDQLRMAKRLPSVEIILRADSAFGVREVIELCEDAGIDFVLGLKGNTALHSLSAPVQMDACLKYKWEGNICREYGDFEYAAGSWRAKRRVVIKAEITQGELNPRFVVTSLDEMTCEDVYDLYCGRGEQENRIKELKLDLASGRTSCQRFLANQFRLLLHTASCMLMYALQEALIGTCWAKAQVGTLRTRLLKVGARIVETTRRVWFHLPSSFPAQEAWRRMHAALVPD